MSKLVVVLPELSPNAASQYAHFVPLLRELSARVEVAVVVEQGGAPPLATAVVIGQRRRSPIGRALELARILVRLRRRGYRYAYGAYSRYFGLVAGTIGRLLGVRTAFWHCREDFFNQAVSRPWRLRDVLLDTAPLVLSLHLCHLLLTGAPSLARNYARRFRLSPHKIRVVPNTVDREALPARSEGSGLRRAPRVLFVGRLTDHKGADLLPPVWRELAAAVPEASLEVVGEGPLLGRLELEFDGDGQAGRVALLGALPNPEARRLMSEADLLLVPSRSEGTPRVLLEAMAAGLPFAATAVGGVGEIVPDLAVAQLARPGEPSEIAAAATRILTQPDLHHALGDAGLQRVRDYEPRVVAATLLKAIGIEQTAGTR